MAEKGEDTRELSRFACVDMFKCLKTNCPNTEGVIPLSRHVTSTAAPPQSACSGADANCSKVYVGRRGNPSFGKRTLKYKNASCQESWPVVNESQEDTATVIWRSIGPSGDNKVNRLGTIPRPKIHGSAYL